MQKNDFIKWLKSRNNNVGNHIVVVNGQIFKANNSNDNLVYYCDFIDNKWKIYEQGANERYPERKELIYEFTTEEEAFSNFAEIIESAEWFFNERK